MTWKTHKLLTATAVLALTGNPLWTLSAAAGSVLPDALEFLIYGQNVPRHKHRKLTHWTALWAVLTMAAFIVAHLLFPFNAASAFEALRTSRLSLDQCFPSLVAHTIAWFLAGALMHCFEDAVTGRVPLLKPSRKSFGKKFLKTGGTGEGLVFLISLFIFGTLIWARF